MHENPRLEVEGISRTTLNIERPYALIDFEGYLGHINAEENSTSRDYLSAESPSSQMRELILVERMQLECREKSSLRQRVVRIDAERTSPLRHLKPNFY